MGHHYYGEGNDHDFVNFPEMDRGNQEAGSENRRLAEGERKPATAATFAQQQHEMLRHLVTLSHATHNQLEDSYIPGQRKRGPVKSLDLPTVILCQEYGGHY